MEMPKPKTAHAHTDMVGQLQDCMLDDCLCVGVCERKCVCDGKHPAERHPDSADGVR